jgi:hypothetical protein
MQVVEATDYFLEFKGKTAPAPTCIAKDLYSVLTVILRFQKLSQAPYYITESKKKKLPPITKYRKLLITCHIRTSVFVESGWGWGYRLSPDESRADIGFR